MRTASPNFWRGKKVLLTGHTGFKGAWLTVWLSQMGAEVTGVSLPPASKPNLFTLANVAQITNNYFTDIRDADMVSSIIRKAQPDIVFHLAAQALVRPSYNDPLGTFATNVMGTANILNSLQGLDSVKVVVVVTTDKVYKNLEHSKPYCETDILSGYDPYSASKAASEIVVSAYRDSYLAKQGIALASARAGNVIGGGDWSEDRLIPDAVRAWDYDLPVVIRRRNAVRPWQHVLEPLNGYLVLAEKIYTNPSLAGAFNFGPNTYEAATVEKVIDLANREYGRRGVLWDDGDEGPHEANLLLLEIAKAREILDVIPRWNIQETIERTMAWYQRQKRGEDANFLCITDIAAFTNTQEAC